MKVQKLLFLREKGIKFQLGEALYFVNLSIQEVNSGAGLELIAENLRLAHESLGRGIETNVFG